MNLVQIIVVVVSTILITKVIKYYVGIEREARAEKKKEREKCTPPLKKRNAYMAMRYTGLYAREGRIAVVGVMLENPEDGTNEYKSFSGRDLTLENLRFILKDVDRLFTFQGSKEILPFLKNCFNIKLEKVCQYRELAALCGYLNLKTDLQELEKELNLGRKYSRLPQSDFETLIRNYAVYGDKQYLDIIEKLNEADLINMRKIRYILEEQVSNVIVTPTSLKMKFWFHNLMLKGSKANS